MPEQRVGCRGTRPAHIHQEEVGHARHHAEAQGPALLRQKLPPRLGDGPGAGHVLLVGERRRRRRLGQAVGIERLAGPVQQADERRRPDPVPNPQARQAVDLGKGAEHQDQPPRPDEPQRVRRQFRRQVLVVGLVQDHQHLGGDRFQEGLQGARRDGRPRRVVGVPDEDQLRPRGDGGADAVQVVGEVREGDGHLGRPGDLRHHVVDDESLLRVHRLVARQQEAAAREFQQLVGAVAQDHQVRRHVPVPGQRLAQIMPAAIRIPMNARQGLPQGLQRQRGRAQGVLVGGELHRVGDPEFALHFFDWLAGGVRDEAAQIRGGEILQRAGQRDTSMREAAGTILRPPGVGGSGGTSPGP